MAPRPATPIDWSDIEPLPTSAQLEAAPVPTEFAPLYYLRLGYSIFRWDEVAVRRASRDPKALLYGMYSYCLGAFIFASILVVPAILASARQEGIVGTWSTLSVLFAGNLFTVLVVIAVGALAVAQLGLCHLIAKWFCGAKGTFLSVLRPLSLAWPIHLLAIVPIGGSVIATVASAAVLMVVFEEVNQIRRLQAFVISFAVNLAVLAMFRTVF